MNGTQTQLCVQDMFDIQCPRSLTRGLLRSLGFELDIYRTRGESHLVIYLLWES